MSNLENIREKILADAKAQVASIEAGAEKEIEALIKPEREAAEREKERLIEQGHRNAENAKERAVNAAELGVRNAKLAAKQGVLEKVYSMAKEALNGLSDEDYTELIKKAVEKVGLKGGETILLQEGREVDLSGLNLSVDEEKVDSGFVLRQGDILYNYKFSDLVDFVRTETEGEIAQSIFGERK